MMNMFCSTHSGVVMAGSTEQRQRAPGAARVIASEATNSATNRRRMLQLASLSMLQGIHLLPVSSEARASALTDFYRGRQQQNADLFLGPIRRSRQRLQAALGLLSGTPVPDAERYRAALKELRAASME